MQAVRIHKRVDSETIHLPALRPMIGRDVEIIILDDQPPPLPYRRPGGAG